MKRLVYVTILLLIMLSAGGCSIFEFLNTHRTLSSEPVKSSPKEPALEPVEEPDTIFPNPFLSKSQDYESKGEFQRSLYYLRVAAEIDPVNSDIKERIVHMEKNIRVRAESHFQKGLVYDEGGEYESAKREWLIAIKTDPGHGKALACLKEKQAPAGSISYTVEAGDTPDKISNKVYHTPHRGMVVSYFYGEESGEGLRPGVVIKLPVLDPELIKLPEKPSEPAVDIENEIAKAKIYLKEKRYAEVLLVAEKILDYDYLNSEAAGFINAVYFEKGLIYYRQENYLEALGAFEKVDPQYRDTAAKVSDVKAILHQRAEEHYLNGVKYFINENLENAIEEWEVTLLLNPDHRKAYSDIQDAKNLLKKLGTVEEITIDE